ncbi:DNA/RNA helicases [Mesobacillus boroniphilus JCM 21738]|uniref:DNA/RNA helicases n=1 Tax=Mesobacillus boroniphilus JCM 21738 TaxID=1294265 RepID=W4RTX1_9BACI|nr:DNA/RNA helicases [Mesobacillus boroniphilus JCM 21738]
MSSVLTESKIRKLFTEAVYRRGVSYYRNGYVRDLVFNPVMESWDAKVRGSTIYHVNVQLDELGIECECDCPAFDQYYSPCKHVAAVLLKIQESESMNNGNTRLNVLSPLSAQERERILQDSQKRRMEEERRQAEERQRIYAKYLTDQFIDAFANQPQPVLAQPVSGGKEQLVVEWICKIYKPYSGNQVLLLEMKVGPKKTYVVRKILEFLNAVQAQRSYGFTSLFSYDPLQHDFSASDKEVIEMLLKSVEYERVYQQMQAHHFRNNSISDERSITISPLLADAFLAKMAEGPVRLEYGGSVYEGVAVHHDELPLTLQLDKGSKQDSFKLDLSDLLLREYLGLYGYLVERNHFYKLSPDQQQYIKEVKELVNKTHNPLLMIDEEQIEPFLSHVVPKMNRIGKLKIAMRYQAVFRNFHCRRRFLWILSMKSCRFDWNIIMVRKC